MRISLCKTITFRTGLTLRQAEEAVKKANRTRAASFFEFTATGEPGDGWALTGWIRGLYDAATADPEDFEISIAED